MSSAFPHCYENAAEVEIDNCLDEERIAFYTNESNLLRNNGGMAILQKGAAVFTNGVSSKGCESMLEVVFGDSARGAVKMAKNFKPNNMGASSIGIIGGEALSKVKFKKERKEFQKKIQEQESKGQALGGNSQDVVSIGFALDIGDISDEIDSEQRKKEFVRVYGRVSFCETEIEDYFRSIREDFEKLLTAAKNRQPIRIWKSHAPFSACGFAFVCNALKDIDCEISVVEFPDYVRNPFHESVFCTDWAEIHPGQFYKFLTHEREISDIEKQEQSQLWVNLKTENAPLRAVVNGRLISVPEEFYDPIIMKSIPDSEFLLAQLIGTILAKYPLGVGDGWYALRINQMIAQGRLEIIGDTDPSHPYGKHLKKITKER